MKKCNIKARGNRLYIDFQKDGTRTRMATGLKNNTFNRKFLEQNFYQFIIDKEAALKKWKNAENNAINARLLKEEGVIKEKASLGECDVRELLKTIAAEKSFLKPGTQTNFTIWQNKIVNFLQGKNALNVKKITRQICVEFVINLKNKGLKKGTILGYVGLFRQILNLAVSLDLINKNPFYMPKMQNEAKMEYPPFTLDEAKILIQNAQGELKSYLIVAFFTGARTGEILGLKWADVNFEQNEISIERTLYKKFLNSPKTPSSRRKIDILPLVRNELLKMRGSGKKSDEFLFKSTRRILHKNFMLLCDSLNISRRRLYDTRHSFASIMLSKGEEPMWVGVKMMGHKNLKITFENYAKYIPQDVGMRAKFLSDFKIENEPNLFEKLA